MVEPLRHRQTKGAATDMPGLLPPRHIPTLPDAEIQTQPERPGSDRSAPTPGPSRGARGASRLPDDDFGLELDLLRAGPAADAVDEEIGGTHPDLIGRDVDGAERGV